MIAFFEKGKCIIVNIATRRCREKSILELVALCVDVRAWKEMVALCSLMQKCLLSKLVSGCPYCCIYLNLEPFICHPLGI